MSEPNHTDVTPPRKGRRATLALIVLNNLPMPNAIHLYDGTGILSMSFDLLADGQAWSTRLGGKTTTRVSKGNRRRYLDEGIINWHGWRVQIHCSEPEPEETPVDSLDGTTHEQLCALVEEDA